MRCGEWLDDRHSLCTMHYDISGVERVWLVLVVGVGRTTHYVLCRMRCGEFSWGGLVGKTDTRTTHYAMHYDV